MQTALDLPTEGFDEQEQSFVAKIREHGWFRTEVLGDDEGPGFSLTTGFWVNAGQPELIIFNLKSDVASDVLWGLFEAAKSGKQLAPGKRTEEAFANLPAYVFAVAEKHYHEFLGWSRWFYCGDHFPCLQIVWPDRAGLFPWESGFDEHFRPDQPDLTERGWRNEIVD